MATQTQKDYFGAVGRRKTSIARVRIMKGNGQLTINGKPAAEYFNTMIMQKLLARPFEASKTTGQFTGTIKVLGGGKESQLGAVIHGIARALTKADPTLRTLVKKEGFLTRDPRAKERRKFGLAQSARAKKQSPKR